MKRIDRYRERLAELEHRRNDSMRRGRYDIMRRLDTDIEELKAELERMEEYESKPIKELLTKDQIEESGILAMLVECHLAADFLTDCTYNVKDAMKKLGLVPVTLVPELEEIRRMAGAFASRLCKINDAFCDFMTDNEFLIAAMHKKTLSYIMSRGVKAKNEYCKNGK